MRRDVFQAIADPTRRQILGLLAKSDMNMNQLSAHFDLSRPAISQQVTFLEECGLVRIKSVGRERLCEARLKRLKEVSRWVEKHQVFWEQKLGDLERFLENEKLELGDRKKKKHNKHGKKSKGNG